MATKLTLMEMRFSKSLTNTTTCRATKSSSALALIRSLRMNANSRDMRYDVANEECLNISDDFKIARWSSKKPTTGWQSDNVSVSTSFWFSKKMQPPPFTPPRYQEEMHGDSTVLWNLTRKKKTIMYIGPNWRVSDSPRKNEDKKHL